jgi:thioredoxin 1
LTIVVFMLAITGYTYYSARRLVGKRVEGAGGGDATHLYYFYSASCGPCRSMTPIIDELADRHGNVTKVDIQQDPETTSKYAVRATPTLVLIKDQVVKDVVLGAKTRKQLEALLLKAG